MNNSNGMISKTSSSSNTAQSQQSQSTGLKMHFKTPEGRYKLHCDKTYPSTLLHYAHGKTVSQVSLLFFFPSLFLILPSQYSFFIFILLLLCLHIVLRGFCIHFQGFSIVLTTLSDLQVYFLKVCYSVPLVSLLLSKWLFCRINFNEGMAGTFIY